MTDSFKHGMMSFRVKHDGTIERLGGQAIDYLATAEIAAVISKLEGLAEVLPGVLNAAEGKTPGSGPAMYNNQRAIKSAVEMLLSYHRDLAMKVDECEREQARQKTEETWESGRLAGITEMQQRAKEARRGRKH